MDDDFDTNLHGDRMTQPVEPHPVQVVDDSEIRMAQAQLYRAAKNSLELHKMLKYLTELEGWVQAKITIAAENLENVKNYIEYEMVSDTLEEDIQEDFIKDKDMPDTVVKKRTWMRVLMDRGLSRIEAGKIADQMEKLKIDPPAQ